MQPKTKHHPMMSGTRIDWNNEYVGANEDEDMKEKSQRAEAKADDQEKPEAAGASWVIDMQEIDTDGPMFSYVDLQIGMPVYHRGKKGWIVDKGPDVVGNTDALHIEISLKEKDRNKRNRYLRRRKTLWVDFHGLTESGGQ